MIQNPLSESRDLHPGNREDRLPYAVRGAVNGRLQSFSVWLNEGEKGMERH